MATQTQTNTYVPVEAILMSSGVQPLKISMQTIHERRGVDHLVLNPETREYELQINFSDVRGSINYGRARYRNLRGITHATLDGEDISPITVCKERRKEKTD